VRRRRDPLITDEDMRRRVRINVRALREGQGLTVRQAAARVKMHRRHWQKVEAGETNLTLLTVARLGLALGVPPLTLLEEPVRRGPVPPAPPAAPGS
jgi:transcriptional regulator with XRE-family HTH domain